MSRVEFPDPAGPPVIISRHGRTTESARQQAAINMRDNLALREQVIAMLALALRLNYTEAVAEHKLRYPESWGL